MKIDALCFDGGIPQRVNRVAIKYGQHSLANAVRENKGTGAPETCVEGSIGTACCKQTSVEE